MPPSGSPDETVGVPAQDPGRLPPEINTGTAHSARVYDYWLGGKDNFAADRRVGDAITAAIPSAPLLARENRAFLRRAVRHLAREAGIRQFLDIGTGIPTAGNTHEVAQAVAPGSRIVYVDNDPIVLAHARALMTCDPAGATAFIQADFREPGKILADPALHRILDLEQPVALMLIALVHFFTDDDDPQGIVSSLVDALPPGSYLTITNLTADFMDPEQAAEATEAGRRGGITYVPRSKAEVAAFVGGLDLVEPGVVPMQAWHPDGGSVTDQHGPTSYVAMARKPGHVWQFGGRGIGIMNG
ncbi:MAG TPA: SAM-dependent methyltransferase [Trebonia sp.]|nr:SAM-dependent methyltransferase [Trebonia sp.]